MNDLLLNRILRSPRVPVLPQVAVEVLATDGNKARAAQSVRMASIISAEPRLRDRLLLTVNSPFYALKESCQTVQQAVERIGPRGTKILTIGLSLVDRLMGGSQAPFAAEYWRRTVYCASAARSCARALKTAPIDACFLTGLLMDVGMLAMSAELGDDYAQVVATSREHARLEAFERERFDLTHAEVAGALARVWKLPDVLQVPMAHHHHPEALEPLAPALRAPAELANLAGHCADVFVGADPGGALADVRRILSTRFAVGARQADDLLGDIADAAEGLGPVFDVQPDPACNLDAVRERARTRPFGARADGTERRRMPRINRDGTLQVRPYLDGIAAADPLRVTFRDASPTGIGFLHTQPMPKGAQFVVELGIGPRAKRVLYTVVRCAALDAAAFEIGARLASEAEQTAVIAPRSARAVRAA